MQQKDQIQLFNEWAARYDRTIKGCRGYPFAGYEQVHEQIVRDAGVHSGTEVLDLGVGTGNLAVRFAALGCAVWGVDFSVEMLAKAREKVPQATLIEADLLGDWPEELDRRFGVVVAAYVLHQFTLEKKIDLLHRLFRDYLGEDGRIIAGDIAFPTVEAREKAHRKWADMWDESEFYWAADETAVACKGSGLMMRYQQISNCGGVFVFERD